MNRLADIDPIPVLEALGVDGVTSVRAVSGGMDTLIWRVRASSGEYELRLFRADQRSQWSKEVEVMRIVSALGIPVPSIAAEGVWEDRPVMLMEWCEGHPIASDALAYPELRERLGISMGQAQARLRARSMPAEYGDDHRGWLSMAGRDEPELETRLRQVGLRDGHILHLDFHPLNVLCDGGEVTAVLDWANTQIGDPRADVARTRSIFRYVSGPVVAAPSHFDSIRAALERAWLHGYTRIRGPLEHMLLFDIWAAIVFLRDMEPYLGRPDFWMKPAGFDRVRADISRLKYQAGLSG